MVSASIGRKKKEFFSKGKAKAISIGLLNDWGGGETYVRAV